MKRVSYHQWDLFARKIFKQNIKEYGHSLSFAGIQQNADKCILEIQPDYKIMIVTDRWKDKMRQAGK